MGHLVNSAYAAVRRDQSQIGQVEGFFDRSKGQWGQRIRDPVEAAFLPMVIPELISGGFLKPFVAEAIARRRLNGLYSTTDLLLRFLEFGFDKQARQLLDPVLYPRFYPIRKFYNDPRYGVFPRLNGPELAYDMGERNLQGNFFEEHGIYHLLSHLLSNRWRKELVVVEAGASEGLGLEKWASHSTHPFEGFQSLKRPRPGEPISNFLEPDEQAQEMIDEFIQREPIIHQAIGFDTQPVRRDERSALDWVFSNTFPMFESLRYPGRVEEFNRLREVISPNVRLLDSPTDARRPESIVQVGSVLPDGKADIIIAKNLFFEMAASDASRILNNFKLICNEGGLCFVTDVAEVKKGAPIRLNGAQFGLEIIRKKWWHRPGSVATYIIDLFNSDQPPIKFCNHLTRHGGEIILTEVGRAILTGKERL